MSFKVKRKSDCGARLYSPWYSDEFEEEREKSLDKIESSQSHGLEKKISFHDDKAKRRLQRHWDRLSDATKSAYQYAAKHFGKYLGLHSNETGGESSLPYFVIGRLISLSYLEATTLVEEYAMWMEEEKEFSPNYINKNIAALRWFADAARRVGWVSWKLDVKGVKPGLVRDSSGPSEAEFRRIIRCANALEGPVGKRTKAIVYLLAFTGLRIGSVISLDMSNISHERKSVRVKWKGKGNSKTNYVWRPVGESTLECLKEWINFRGLHDGPVFTATRPTKNVKRLTIRKAQRDIADLGQSAATRKRLTPHAFRHFFATDNLKEEADTRKVMRATGHTNIKTIEFYDDAKTEDAREIFENMESRWLTQLDETEYEDEQDIHDRYESSREDSEEDGEDEEEEPQTFLESIGVVSSEEVAENVTKIERLSTGIEGVDYLLGGEEGDEGLALGSIVLIAGGRGLGKSTLVRQICHNICQTNPRERVLLASSEETPEQISVALNRIGALHKNFYLVSERRLESMLEAAASLDASVLVIDSISMVSVERDEEGNPVRGRPGSVSQVKASGQKLLSWCKGVSQSERSDIIVIVICHVTSSGEIAGPTEIEHAVDAIYNFTSPSKRSSHRTLSCEGKNRFGDSTRQINCKMTSKGISFDGVEREDDYSVFDEEYEDSEEEDSWDE